MKKNKLLIGKFEGKDVFSDPFRAPNQHICLVGQSGCGKTVMLQNLVKQKTENGERSLVFDMHGSLSEDQIFEPYHDSFNRYRNDIYAEKTGIPCNLFTAITYPDGAIESPSTTAGAAADILSRAMKLGPMQTAIMRRACESVMSSGKYHKEGISALGTELKRIGSKTAAELYERLHGIIETNALVEGDGLFEENKINVLHLSRLDLNSQDILAEIILAHVWRLANADQFKNNPLNVVVDECQNLNSEAKSSLSLAISEGRRMGINLVLATQMILLGTTNSVQQRISQCGLILYGQPASNRVTLTAKTINSANADDWVLTLRNLEVGQFVATGNFSIGGRPIDYPVVIDAREEVAEVPAVPVASDRESTRAKKVK